MDKKRGYSFETAVNMLMEHINCTEKEAIEILEILEGEVENDRGTKEKEIAATNSR